MDMQTTKLVKDEGEGENIGEKEKGVCRPGYALHQQGSADSGGQNPSQPGDLCHRVPAGVPYLPQDVLTALKQSEEGIPLYRDTLPTDVQVCKIHLERHVHFCRTVS